MNLSVLASLEDENSNLSDFSEQSNYFTSIGLLAEDLNFSTIFLFKNSTNKKNLVSDPLLLQAGLAPIAKRLRLGVGFAPLSFLDPITLAETCATLDVMSQGRLTIAVDEGARLRTHASINLNALPIDRQHKENRELLRTALRGERFNAGSANRRATNLQISVRPLQFPHPPIFAAIYDKDSAAEAGASGFQIFLAPLAALRSKDDVATIVGAYRAAQSAAGFSPDPDDIIAFCISVAAPDHQHAVEKGRSAFGRHALVRPNWICRNFDEAMDHDYFLVGGPTVLARKMRAMRDVGVNHLALMPTFGGLGAEQSMMTMRVMADVAAENFGAAAGVSLPMTADATGAKTCRRCI